MSNKKETNTPMQLALISDLESQREFIKKKKQDKGFDFSLVVADAFVRGIRDIGYKSTATALDELIDNSIQAGASNIHVFFGYQGTSNKPTQIAIVDDGHGMDPDMIRVAMMWGGTHRENDRTGFGRYGYGLPSACVSQGRHFDVYSQTEDGDLYKSQVDVDAISEGKYTNKEGRIVIPEPIKDKVPNWLSAQIKKGFKNWERGTVVILDKLDRLSWTTREGLTENLLEHFGLVYRNFLRQVSVFVDGKAVEPIDPLFTTPGARYYDLDDDRAEALEPLFFRVKGKGNLSDREFTVRVRYSYMPPTFGRQTESKQKSDIGRHNNKRFPIMKEHNGIIVLRNGRQIDVVTKCPWTTFVNYDRNWGIEVDFEGGLDEEFQITTSKQQIVISERIWDLLKQHGVYRAIENLRNRLKEALGTLNSSLDQGDQGKARPSEEAMKEAAKFKTRKLIEPTIEEKSKNQKKFEEQVAKVSKQTGIAPEVIEEQLLLEQITRPYVVKKESMPGAPFYRTEQIGGQVVLYLNTAHRFFTDVYASKKSSSHQRAALEVLLFVLGDCELDANEERRRYYQAERSEWSNRLSTALDILQLHVTEVEEQPDLQEA